MRTDQGIVFRVGALVPVSLRSGNSEWRNRSVQKAENDTA